MKKREFQDLLADGYGSALIFLSECGDPMAYSRQIMYCCTHNTCYDIQSEGDRSVYLHDAVKLTGQTEYFKDKLTEHLQKYGFSDDYENYQILKLLVCFYEDGFGDVLGFMEQLWEKTFARLSEGGAHPSYSIRSGFENLCITLSRIEPSYYFKTVSEVGEYLVKNPGSDIFGLDWFCHFMRKNLTLKELSEKVPRKYLKAFLSEFDCSKQLSEWKKLQKGKEAPQFRYKFDALIDVINGDELIYPRKRIAALSFGRNAPESELIKLAEAIKSEKNEEKLRLMLAAFEKTDFPLEADIIFDILKSDSDLLRAKVFAVMCGISDIRVKEYAKSELDKLTENYDFWEHEAISSAFRAFLSQPDKNDGKYILQKLDEAEKSGKFDVNDFHSIYGDIQEAYDKNPTRSAKEVLTHIYRRLKCTVCRLDVIKTMSKCRCLSSDILKECALDGNTDTREYARKIMKRRNAEIL